MGISYNFKRHFATAGGVVADISTCYFDRPFSETDIQIKLSTLDDVNASQDWRKKTNPHGVYFDWVQQFEQDIEVNKKSGIVHRSVVSIFAKGALCGLTHYGVQDRILGVSQTEAKPHENTLRGLMRYFVLQTALITARGLSCEALLDAGPFHNPVGEKHCKALGFLQKQRDGFCDYVLPISKASEFFDPSVFRK